MKKSKAILVTVLAVILCVMCAVTTTFSWFTRPQTQNGISMKWSNTAATDSTNAVAYNISNGNGITMQTFESADGETYGDTAVTAFGGTINASGRKYYRTDISNISESKQNVSLYLSNLNLPNNSGNGFHIGTNGPLKTYKSYAPASTSTASKTALSVNKKNVYVGFNKAHTYNYSDYGLHAWRSFDGYYGNFSVNNEYLGEKSYLNYTYKTYTCTVNYDFNCAIMKKSLSEDYFGGNNTDIDTNNIIGMFKNDSQDDITDFASAGGSSAGINTFYSQASVEKGKTTSLAASGQGTITYKSANTGIATVDSSSGTVTGVKAGTTTITATSTGVYGDVITSTCEVTVFENTSSLATDTPIVTNYEITAGNTESVYWYIKNDGSTAITYTIDDVYLTL